MSIAKRHSGVAYRWQAHLEVGRGLAELLPHPGRDRDAGALALGRRTPAALAGQQDFVDARPPRLGFQERRQGIDVAAELLERAEFRDVERQEHEVLRV